MSQENVQLVKAALDAWTRDGVDAALSYWTDDLDHRAVEGAIDDRGPIHGKDAMRGYAEDWLETFDDFKTEAVELIDAGDDLGDRGSAGQRARKAKRCRDQLDVCGRLHHPRREDRAWPRVLDPRGSPRSRRPRAVEPRLPLCATCERLRHRAQTLARRAKEDSRDQPAGRIAVDLA